MEAFYGVGLSREIIQEQREMNVILNGFRDIVIGQRDIVIGQYADYFHWDLHEWRKLRRFTIRRLRRGMRRPKFCTRFSPR